MVITEMTYQESLAVIAKSNLARLACANENQPYLVPINYVLDHGCIYSFATFGRKIDWMRANPLVCVGVDEIIHSRQWQSVVAFGRYEELDGSQPNAADRHLAWKLLQRRPNWWQPAYVKTVISGEERPLAPIFFRIQLDEVSGHRIRQPVAPAERADGAFSRFVRNLIGEAN